MKQIRNFVLLVSLFFLGVSLRAQDYKSAIGLRVGSPSAISYKTFLNTKGAVEATVGYRNWLYVSALTVGVSYQHHTPIPAVPGLKWYAGGGVGASFWRYKSTYFGTNDGSTSINLFAIGGLDYAFKDFPLNLSLDWSPTFYFGNSGYVNGLYVRYSSLSARYILGSKK